MAIESKYKFQQSPLFDGVIELVKDGRVTICPKGQTAMIPHPTLEGQAIMMRSACTKSCPFFQSVNLTKKDGSGTEPGYVLQCMDKPMPILVDEAEIPAKKSKLELLK